MRGYLVAAVCCGVLIAGCTIASAVLLADIVAGVITDPQARTIHRWAWPLAILLALWAIRTLTRWLQARLAQHGATAVIADLSRQVLHAVAELPPRRLAERRDAAAAVLTRGLDRLRPYFTAYLPALILAAILTPATVAVIAAYDVESAVIVLIALPLIPIFMVLIGLATTERSAAALTAMTTLQARLLDLVAGIPTLRALNRAGGSVTRIAELGAAHRRSTMATLRIAFLSALVLELLATLGVALVAVSIGLRLVFGHMTLVAGLTALLLAPEVFLATAPRRDGIPRLPRRKNRGGQGVCARRREGRHTTRRPPRTRPRRGDSAGGAQRRQPQRDAARAPQRSNRTGRSHCAHRTQRRR